MSLSSIFTALFISVLSTFYGAEKSVRSIRPLEPKQCTAIVFDLGGVVLDTSTKGTLWQIGYKSLFDYWRDAKRTTDLKQMRSRLYAFLNAAHPKQPEGNQWGLKDEEGQEMPQLMAEWLRGMRPNKEIHAQVKLFAQNNLAWFSSVAERRVLLNIARLTFKPDIFIKTRKIYSESAQLIRECKERGFKLYVLSNWDRESGKLLIDAHQDLFNLFDGIILSGDVQSAKPEPEIFSHITQEIPARQCVFIDDQPENVQTARDLGFNTILAQKNRSPHGHPNIQAIRAQLHAIEPSLSQPAHA